MSIFYDISECNKTHLIYSFTQIRFINVFLVNFIYSMYGNKVLAEKRSGKFWAIAVVFDAFYSCDTYKNKIKAYQIKN